MNPIYKIYEFRVKDGTKTSFSGFSFDNLENAINHRNKLTEDLKSDNSDKVFFLAIIEIK